MGFRALKRIFGMQEDVDVSLERTGRGGAIEGALKAADKAGEVSVFDARVLKLPRWIMMFRNADLRSRVGWEFVSPVPVCESDIPGAPFIRLELKSF